MNRQFDKRIRRGLLALSCGAALVASSASAFAQATPPAKPSNVSAPPRYYIVESIVVVALFAGAIFGVCRSSGRT